MSLCSVKAENVANGSLDITTGYAGDFLSHVMGGAPHGCIWFTVMNNINVAAVAHLADCSAVVICDGIPPDSELLQRCKQQGINLFTTGNQVYSACVNLWQALEKSK